MSTANTARAADVADNKVLELLARAGLVAYGLVHIVIAALATQIAWGDSAGDSADLTGALRQIGKQPFGRILLWGMTIALAALALWQASIVFFARRSENQIRGRERIRSAFRSVLYGWLTFIAGKIALGHDSSGSRSAQETTSGVLSWPGGKALVVIVGLVILGSGVGMIIQGARKGFRKRLDESQMSPAARAVIEHLGLVGYIVKGLTFVLIGWMIAHAALTFDPHEAAGLNGAVYATLAQPFGRFLLTAMAVGFASFGAYELGASRYQRL
jgi:hypothetical protein